MHYISSWVHDVAPGEGCHPGANGGVYTPDHHKSSPGAHFSTGLVVVGVAAAAGVGVGVVGGLCGGGDGVGGGDGGGGMYGSGGIIGVCC